VDRTREYWRAGTHDQQIKAMIGVIPMSGREHAPTNDGFQP